MDTVTRRLHRDYWITQSCPDCQIDLVPETGAPIMRCPSCGQRYDMIGVTRFERVDPIEVTYG